MNPFHRPPKVQYVEFGPQSSAQIERLIKALDGSSIGETMIKQDLRAIIEMLKPQTPVPATMELIKDELSTVHELVFNLASADPEKIQQLAESVKTVREKLKTSVDKQTKETK